MRIHSQEIHKAQIDVVIAALELMGEISGDTHCVGTLSHVPTAAIGDFELAIGSLMQLLRDAVYVKDWHAVEHQLEKVRALCKKYGCGHDVLNAMQTLRNLLHAADA